MQRANCLVSLGGDHGNSVPKNLCTAAEIAVLREIHGDDAVNEIQPVDDIKRSNRDERSRLLAIYGAARYPDQKPIVETMFPGVAARVYETLDELDLDESFFKPTGRLKARPAVAPVEAKPAEQVSDVAGAEEADEVEEGVGEDMDDEHAEVEDDSAPVAEPAPAPKRQTAAAKAAAEKAAKAAVRAAAKKKASVFD